VDAAVILQRPLAMDRDSPVVHTDPDVELMLRFQNGDLAAFEALFARHSRALVSFAYRFVRNLAVAEELAQDTFLRVHDAANGYRASARFTTWLYRIATNVCLNEVRRPRFRAVHQSLDGPQDDPDMRPLELIDSRSDDPLALIHEKTVARALRTALAHLPEKQRLAFILNKYQELSYAEVAEVMRTSEKAVKSLIHRAKEALAARLRTSVPELLNR